MPLTDTILHDVLEAINVYDTTPSEILVSLLHRTEDRGLTDTESFRRVVLDAEEILEALRTNDKTRDRTMSWAQCSTTDRCRKEVETLVKKESGLRFVARKAEVAQLTDFSLEGLASKMQELAPCL